MGLTTYKCPITGETITVRHANGAEPALFYSAGATIEQIDAFEAATAGPGKPCAFQRYPHQVPRSYS